MGACDLRLRTGGSTWDSKITKKRRQLGLSIGEVHTICHGKHREEEGGEGACLTKTGGREGVGAPPPFPINPAGLVDGLWIQFWTWDETRLGCQHSGAWNRNRMGPSLDYSSPQHVNVNELELGQGG